MYTNSDLILPHHCFVMDMKYQSLLLSWLGALCNFGRCLGDEDWLRMFQQRSHGQWAALWSSTWFFSAGCGHLMFTNVHYSVHEGIDTSILDQVLFYTCKKKDVYDLIASFWVLGRDASGTVCHHDPGLSCAGCHSAKPWSKVCKPRLQW